MDLIDNRAMRVEYAVLRHVEMPLKFRFRTSFGETGVKKFLLLEPLRAWERFIPRHISRFAVISPWAAVIRRWRSTATTW